MKKKLQKKILNVLLSVLLKLAIAGGIFFVVTFTMYIFNLDMKLMAVIAPWLEKWYDHLEHNQYI